MTQVAQASVHQQHRSGRRRRRGFAAIVLAGALIGAACGGNDDDSAGSDAGNGAFGDDRNDLADLADAIEQAEGHGALVADTCGLLTEDELAEFSAVADPSIQDNGDECWVSGGDLVVFGFSPMTPSAWAATKAHWGAEDDLATTPPDAPGDDAFLRSREVILHVLAGPVQVRVYTDAFGDDAQTTVVRVAALLLERADLADSPAVAGIPDVSPCDLVSEEEFVAITGAEPNPFTGWKPRPGDGLECEFSAGLGEPSIRVAIVQAMSPGEFRAVKGEAASIGFVDIVDADPVGDDSFAYVTDFMDVETYYLDLLVAGVRVTIEVVNIDDNAAVAGQVAQLVADQL